MEFLKSLTLTETLYVLIQANMTGKVEIAKKCANKIMATSTIVSFIQWHAQNMYGRYACEELKYVYDSTSYEYFYADMWDAAYKYLFKLVDDEKHPFPKKDGLKDLSSETGLRLLKGILRPVIRHTFVHSLQNVCRSEFGLATITVNDLSLYAQMRTATNYSIDLSDSNEEILKALKKANQTEIGCFGVINETKLNKLREKFFCHELEHNSFQEDLSFEESFENSELLKDIFKTANLNEKELFIIQCRYKEKKPMTFENIGKVLHISECGVIYHERKALKKLKEAALLLA